MASAARRSAPEHQLRITALEHYKLQLNKLKVRLSIRQLIYRQGRSSCIFPESITTRLWLWRHIYAAIRHRVASPEQSRRFQILLLAALRAQTS
jgi:hypothetical protein